MNKKKQKPAAVANGVNSPWNDKVMLDTKPLVGFQKIATQYFVQYSGTNSKDITGVY